MSGELRRRAVDAVHAYRAADSGGDEHLALLRQDGHRDLAHDLTMERVLPVDDAGPYTARIDAWVHKATG